MANAKIVFDEFIKSVKPDARSAEGIIFLTGWIGESPEKECIRVYFDIGLSQFSDVRQADIIHAVQNSKEESSLGGSKLWIRQPAPVVSTPAGSFLEGEIFNAYANQMYQPTVPPALAPTHQIICVTQPTRFFPCTETCRPTFIPPCGFTHNHLPSVCVPCTFTVRAVCVPTIHGLRCPISLQVRCPIPTTICPVQSANVICGYPTLRCGSIVDACVTAPTDPTIWQQNPAVFQNPAAFGTGVFNPYIQGGGFGF